MANGENVTGYASSATIVKRKPVQLVGIKRNALEEVESGMIDGLELPAIVTLSFDKPELEIDGIRYMIDLKKDGTFTARRFKG